MILIAMESDDGSQSVTSNNDNVSESNNSEFYNESQFENCQRRLLNKLKKELKGKSEEKPIMKQLREWCEYIKNNEIHKFTEENIKSNILNDSKYVTFMCFLESYELQEFMGIPTIEYEQIVEIMTHISNDLCSNDDMLDFTNDILQIYVDISDELSGIYCVMDDNIQKFINNSDNIDDLINLFGGNNDMNYGMHMTEYRHPAYILNKCYILSKNSTNKLSTYENMVTVFNKATNKNFNTTGDTISSAFILEAKKEKTKTMNYFDKISYRHKILYGFYLIGNKFSEIDREYGYYDEHELGFMYHEEKDILIRNIVDWILSSKEAYDFLFTIEKNKIILNEITKDIINYYRSNNVFKDISTRVFKTIELHSKNADISEVTNYINSNTKESKEYTNNKL